jgi:hypothetical protein
MLAATAPFQYGKGRNSCFLQTTVAEKFYARKNAPNTAADTGASSLLASLARCNVVMGLINIDTKKMYDAVSLRAGASGIGANMTFLDYGCLEDIAGQFGNVGRNANSGALAPVSQYVFDSVTKGVRKHFLSTDLHIPSLSFPVSDLIAKVLPMGILSTKMDNGTYVKGVGHYTNTVLLRGPLTRDFEVYLPSDKCVGLERVRSHSPIVGSNLCLYMAIAPSDEALCGTRKDRVTTKIEAAVTALARRSFGEKYVQDQPYTTVFIFAGAELTEHGVLEDLFSRCLTYTAVGQYGPFFREAAVVRIGHLNGKRSCLDLGRDVITIKEMNVDIGAWKWGIFKYGTFVDVSREEVLIAERPAKRRRKASPQEVDADDAEATGATDTAAREAATLRESRSPGVPLPVDGTAGSSVQPKASTSQTVTRSSSSQHTPQMTIDDASTLDLPDDGVNFSLSSSSPAPRKVTPKSGARKSPIQSSRSRGSPGLSSVETESPPKALVTKKKFDDNTARNASGENVPGQKVLPVEHA